MKGIQTMPIEINLIFALYDFHYSEMLKFLSSFMLHLFVYIVRIIRLIVSYCAIEN